MYHGGTLVLYAHIPALGYECTTIQWLELTDVNDF